MNKGGSGNIPKPPCILSYTCSVTNICCMSIIEFYQLLISNHFSYLDHNKSEPSQLLIQLIQFTSVWLFLLALLHLGWAK